MPNIQLHPTRKMVIPNDIGTKQFFWLHDRIHRELIVDHKSKNLVEMKKHPKHGTIKTPVEFSIAPRVAEEDPSVLEVLTRFDNDVANVCISEWEAGNRYVTYSTIYRTLTGRVGESDANPSKV